MYQGVSIMAMVGSPRLQRVTLLEEGSPHPIQWVGSGEGVKIGGIQLSGDKKVSVSVESSDDNGETFKPSSLVSSTWRTLSLPSFVMTTIKAEDDGDNDSDFDDAVVYVSWLTK
ncbi:fucose-binding lectin II [Streptomyces clavifer]|uniref:fucose-binding lectin II n=1 Tax=Streptomyces clavifer TaxID=68188 RepID=UPI0036530397